MPASTITIRATCERGHVQAIQVDAALGRRWAIQLAGLLDGTSDLFVSKPDHNSMIGRCGICGAHLKCEVLGFGRPED